MTMSIGYAQEQKISFDSSLLNNGGKEIDISILENGGQLPGEYTVDIFLNGMRVDSRDMVFENDRDSKGNTFLKTCVTREMLVRYGVNIKKYPKLFKRGKGNKHKEPCADLSVIPDSTERFEFTSQKLMLSIPQVALLPKQFGIAPEELWDDGITAFLLNWQVNANRSEYRGLNASENESFWASFEPGLNFGPWRVRNLSTWQKVSNNKGKWNTAYTRAERGLNRIKSRLILGEHYTSSEIFESTPYRGVMIRSDESMVPFNLREFAPVVKGIAQTQASVEVRQNGYLIYNVTVAPGAFSLEDLPVTGSGGDLEVTVLETNGTKQVFTVPFTTPAIALREGYFKYSFTAGQYRSSDSSVNSPIITQGTAMYGLPWGITAFGGAQFSEHYFSADIGVGLSMGSLGAISLDSMYTQGSKKGFSKEKGNSWRLRYNKAFESTGTSFTAASYQYSSNGYNTMSDVLDTYSKNYENSYAYKPNRSRTTTLGMSQTLGNIGYISINGSRDEFRDSFPHKDYITASYSTSWNNISWSFNWSRSINKTDASSNKWNKEDIFSVWVSIPLGQWIGSSQNNIRATGQFQSTTGQETRYETGLSGEAFERRLNWDIREQLASGGKINKESSRFNVAWHGTYGEITGMYSYNNRSRQMSTGFSGALVAHKDGITLGQKTGDTIALIEAPNVTGAQVRGTRGVRTDFRGLTLMGNTTPYQENIISLDPTTFPEDAEVSRTDSRVVPTKGAVVRAKFETEVGNRALITLTHPDGKALPFGAVVTAMGKSKGTSIVGDNGEVYISGLLKKGKIQARWGTNNQCLADFQIPNKKGPAGIYMIHAVCK
ncbi:fimbria/pilus outer membrane usher protein [Klebsiella variicola]|nr:fimbria/pilus outer membrane usher protein [Klebsiella variicola]